MLNLLLNTIYHIYSEFTKNILSEHGNNQKKHIKLSTDNVYRVNNEGFFSQNFIPPKKVRAGN